MLLKDKVVIVTGAGPGMGQAMCRGAAAEGAKVVVSARSEDAINSVRDEIVAAGGEAIAVRCDVTSTEDCNALVKAATDKWGRIDGMVHSAYYHPKVTGLANFDLGEVTRTFDVIALGGLRMAQATIPIMKAQGGGSIVNISSIATRAPMRGEGAYAMAKSALNQLSRQLAVELSGTGIRVNTALMGWMAGASLDDFLQTLGDGGDAYRKQRCSEIPLGRIPPDKDCARAVYFLLSDHASEITGAALDVNGGEWVAV